MTTNNKARAEALAAQATETFWDTPEEVAMVGATLALAQVHATLALAEQQERTADALDALVALGKTANQIAWHAQGHAGWQTRNQIDAAVNL